MKAWKESVSLILTARQKYVRSSLTNVSNILNIFD